jgi:hypothetical protein
LEIATHVLILHAFRRWPTDCTSSSVSAQSDASLRDFTQAAVAKDGTP